MKKDILERLREGLLSSGVKRYGMNKVVAEKTEYSEGLVAKALKGHATLTPRFIQAVCAAFGIDREWVELGDNISGWRERVAAKFYEETGELATPEDIEAGNVRHQSQNHAKLLRLHERLTFSEIPESGRAFFVSNITGYTEAEVVGILIGISPLTDDFMDKLCTKLGIIKDWVDLGDSMEIKIGEYRTTIGGMEKRLQKIAPSLYSRSDPSAGGDAPPFVEKPALDAPAQEIVNDMKRLTETNRWVFVGKVKPIIQAMIEEQGEVKAERS